MWIDSFYERLQHWIHKDVVKLLLEYILLSGTIKKVAKIRFAEK